MPSAARLAVALLAALLAGCGDDAPPADGEDWPLAVSTDGVLAYAAAPVTDALRANLEELFDAPLASLAVGRRAVLLHLDARVFGGQLALALPAHDAAALRESIAFSPFTQRLDAERFRLRLPPEHPLSVADRAVSSGLGLAGGAPGTRSLEQVGELLGGGGLDVPLRLADAGEHTLLAPSLEGVVVLRRALPQLGGLAAPGGPLAVLGLHVERLKDTYHDELQQLLGQARGALLGVGAAGMLGMLGSAANQRVLSELPVPPAGLWALLEMSDLQRVTRAALELREAPGTAGLAADLFEGGQLTLRVEHEPGAPLRALLDTLRPAPAVPGASVVLAADPDAAAAALAAWLRPLAVRIHGDGPSSRRWQDELVTLLAPWDGRLVVGAHGARPYALALGVRPGRAWDAAALAAWAAPLAGQLGVEPLAPAELAAVTDAREQHGFTLLAADAADAAELERLAAGADAATWERAPADAPVLRSPLVELAVPADGPLRVTLRAPPTEGR